MAQNIQVAHSVPSNQFLHYFGFHIALMKRGYDGQPCELKEGIGRYWDIYDCIEKFEKLSQVENYLKLCYKEQFDKSSTRLSEIKWSLSTLFKQNFFVFGVFNELKTKIEELKKIKEQSAKLLADPLAHTPIKKLSDQISVPKYLIGGQDYYYYPSIVGNLLVVRKLQLVNRTIEKINIVSPYTHSFNYDFCDVDDKKFTLNYSFLNVYQFDGAKWGSELGATMLFLSEEDAKNHVSAFYAQRLGVVV